MRRALIVAAALLYGCVLMPAVIASAPPGNTLDANLGAALTAAGFTGRIQQTYPARIEATLGRPLDPRLAEIGRLLWFDTLHSLHADNTCGGCHSPTNGFGDSQPMAIGVQNNGVVGPHRAGPRNQRRSPLVINTALYPALMWNGRFNSASGDPFDNSQGFRFPLPEGDERFSWANDVAHGVRHLLQAQAHMPPTELIEVAGFTGTCPGGVPDQTLGEAFCQLDDGLGELVPLPDPATGSRNEPIRQQVLELLNATPAYRALFGDVFPEVKQGAPIDFFMFGKAIAEFEFTLVFADAPLDQFARGNPAAMTAKRSAERCCSSAVRAAWTATRLPDSRTRCSAISPSTRSASRKSLQLSAPAPAMCCSPAMDMTRTSASRRSQAIQPIDTSSVRHRFGIYPWRQASSITGRSHAWKTPSVFTWASSRARARMTLPRPACHRTWRSMSDL